MSNRSWFQHCVWAVSVLGAMSASASATQALQEDFKIFAAKEVVNFGGPKDTVLTLQESLSGFFVSYKNDVVGNARIFEHCQATVEGTDDLKMQCHQGISGAVDLCKIDSKICKNEGVREKLREVSLEPDHQGRLSKLIGQRMVNPHFHYLTGLIKKYPMAKKAMAQAMVLNGCTKVHLGDVIGQITYLRRDALGDDDTDELFPGAENSWRAIIECADATAPVYVDVIRAVENNGINLKLQPIKAAKSEKILLERLEKN